MDELVFQFLLQAGYPRASIVLDASLLEPARGDAAAPENMPTYAVVDPETIDRLAVIDVVGAIDTSALAAAAKRVGRHAERLGGQGVQGFVIRIDPAGRNDAEQVRFYRVWPVDSTRQLTAKTFPDLDGLRVTHRLAVERAARTVTESADVEEDAQGRTDAVGRRGGARVARYVPALVLVLLAVVDYYLAQTRGGGLLNVVQAGLTVGGAALLTVLAIARDGD